MLLGMPGCTGTIGAGGDTGDTTDAAPPGNPDAGPPAPTPLRISEIMYNPVLEEDFEDWHEFVEIHNPHDQPVPLDGWSLAGGITYRFPAGAEIPAGGYTVVAKSRDRLLEIAAYALDPAAVHGDYQGSLDNGGDTVALLAPGGALVEAVTYDDAQPWPVAADALGAGESWLDPSLLPLEQHRYSGHSLERVSFAVAASSVANWTASPLDGATPGRPGSNARPMPLAAVESLYVAPVSSEESLIRAADQVRIHVRFTSLGELPAAPLVVEHFVDDVARTDEVVQTVALVDDGGGAYSAVLPPQPEQSIVRYRVRAGDGEAGRLLSPRPDDPFAWHAYFVSPKLDSNTRVYQLFIAPDAWTSMWTNIQGGRVASCQPREEWNRKVPAVFVYEGKVYDVQVRHQGSRYNRTLGNDLAAWPYPGPSEPSPVRALSWRIAFPRYARFEGKQVIILGKLKQSCPGLNAGVGFRLFQQTGLPMPAIRYARLHINGGYYHYAQEIERPGDDMLRRYHEEEAQASGAPERPIGHLFKATGCNCDEGPYGFADGRLLDDHCGWSAADRYAFTYDRKNYEWAGHDPLIALIEGLHVARAQGTEAVRTYLADNFDIDRVLGYLAVMNWSVPFDDMFHNHYLYQRLDDGKWMLLPWDLDVNFGGFKGDTGRGAGASIYIGEEGDPDNRNGWWNYFKDSFLKAYRPEFEARLKALSQTILHPDNVGSLVDEMLATVDPTEAAAAPAGLACSLEGTADRIKKFAQDRHAVVSALP